MVTLKHTTRLNMASSSSQSHVFFSWMRGDICIENHGHVCPNETKIIRLTTEFGEKQRIIQPVIFSVEDGQRHRHGGY